MSATQIIDFLQSNAILIAFDPAVTYPQGYIVEYDQKLYIANDEVPAGTGFVTGSTGATFSVLNPTDGLTDAELRAEPVDVRNPFIVSEERFVALADGPAPVEYLTGEEIRRVEIFSALDSSNTFVWFNITANAVMTTDPLPADLQKLQTSDKEQQIIGNAFLEEIRDRLPASLGVLPAASSLSVALSNGHTVMEVTQYNVITATAQYSVGNILRKSVFFNTESGATETKWYNLSTAALLTATPNLAHLSVRADKIAPIGQLPAQLGLQDESESLSVVVANQKAVSVLEIKLFDVLTAGTGYAVSDVLRRLTTFDALSNTTSVSWYNETQDSDIAAPSAAHITEKVVPTDTSVVSKTFTYEAVAVDTDYAIGDIIFEVQIIEPSTAALTSVWRNITQNATITQPNPSDIILIGGSDPLQYTQLPASLGKKDEADSLSVVVANKSLEIFSVVKYSAVADDTVNSEYLTGDEIISIDYIDKETSDVTRIWRNSTQDTVVSEPPSADLSTGSVTDPLQYSQLPASLGLKDAEDSLSVVVANRDVEILNSTTEFVAIAAGTGYAVGNVIHRYTFFNKETAAIRNVWKNVTTSTVLSVTPVFAHLGPAKIYTKAQYFQLPESLGLKDPEQSLSVVVSNNSNRVLLSTTSYTATADAVNGLDYLTGNTIVKFTYLDVLTSLTTEVWNNATVGVVITAPDPTHLGSPVVADPLQYSQLPASLGLQPAEDSLSVVVANVSDKEIFEVTKYEAINDDTVHSEYVTTDKITKIVYIDKQTSELTTVWRNNTQDSVLANVPPSADLSTGTVEDPLTYTQLPETLGRKASADSLSVTLANEDNKTLLNGIFFTVNTTGLGYTAGETVSVFYFLDNTTAQTYQVWRNETQNSVLSTPVNFSHLTPVRRLGNATAGQLPFSLGKKLENESLSVVVANKDLEVLRLANYTATVIGVGYNNGDEITKIEYINKDDSTVSVVWKNQTQNTTIAEPNAADLSTPTVSDPLVYSQLPASLGLQDEADSLSVVVANRDMEIIESKTLYTAIASDASYNIADVVERYTILNKEDFSIRFVWRNITQNTIMPANTTLADFEPQTNAAPLVYEQLPASLGLQDEADSLSVVVANQQTKVLLSTTVYTAVNNSTDPTQFEAGDKIAKYTYVDNTTWFTTDVWVNTTNNTSMYAPDMADLSTPTVSDPLIKTQLPESLGLQDVDDSLSVAVANKDPVLRETVKFVATADDTVNSEYLTGNKITKTVFIAPQDGSVSSTWYNESTDSVIVQPNAADIEEVVAPQPDPAAVLAGDVVKHYLAKTASATVGKYAIGNIVRVIETYNIEDDTLITKYYNQSTAAVIDEFDISHFDEIVQTSVNKEIVSVDKYQAFMSSVVPGEYALNDILRRIELFDFSTNTTEFVWKNLNTGAVVTTVNMGGVNQLTGDPLQFNQLPVSLGLKDPEDSLSVVVTDQLSDVLIEKKLLKATAAQTDFSVGDLVWRFHFYNPNSQQTTFRWYNISEDADVGVPGDDTLFTPEDQAQATSTSKIKLKSERYKATVSGAGFTVNDILTRTVFVDLSDDSSEVVWYNERTNGVIFNSTISEIDDVTRLGDLTQLPVSLGRKENDESVSVVQSNPIAQTINFYEAKTANPPHYQVGDVLRRWEVLDVYADTIIVKWTNKRTLLAVPDANVNPAHIEEVAENIVKFKPKERVPGFYSVDTNGTIASGTVSASIYNIGTTDATVAGGTLSPGFVVTFEAPKGDTLAAITYTSSPTARLLINTLT